MNEKEMIERLERLIEQAEGAKQMIRMGMVLTSGNYQEPGMEHYDFRIGHFRIKEGFAITSSGSHKWKASEPCVGWTGENDTCDCP